MRPEEPKMEAEGREWGGVLGEWAASPTSYRGYGSGVNKTKFLRPRPK